MDDAKKDEAQEELRDAGVEVGQRYRHYKGGYYRIVAVGVKEDTLEPMVGYRSELKGTTWFRTLDNFREIVPVDADLVSRFRRVSDDEV